MKPLRPARTAAALAAAALMQACVVVPRSVSVYDERCGVHMQQLVLGVDQVAVFAGCQNDGCIALLAAAGAVTAVSAVISGSIVVAGNIVQWLERAGGCPAP